MGFENEPPFTHMGRLGILIMCCAVIAGGVFYACAVRSAIDHAALAWNARHHQRVSVPR
jgi:hypothetical protein